MCREYAWALNATAHTICQLAFAAAHLAKDPDTSLKRFLAPACHGLVACRPSEPAAHHALALEAHMASNHQVEKQLHSQAMKLAEEQDDPFIGAMSAW